MILWCISGVWISGKVILNMDVMDNINIKDVMINIIDEGILMVKFGVNEIKYANITSIPLI